MVPAGFNLPYFSKIARDIWDRKEATIAGGLTYSAAVLAYSCIRQTPYCEDAEGSIKNVCMLVPIAGALMTSFFAKNMLKVSYASLFSLGFMPPPDSDSINGRINIIGRETYLKSCSKEERWSSAVSEQQAEKIASGIKEGVINIRLVQEGDNLGRIAEGLSKGRIQLQKDESLKPLVNRPWTTIPIQEAQGWKETTVAYVCKRGVSDDKLLEQAENNRDRTLFNAGIIHKDQSVALTGDLKVIIGSNHHDVFHFIQGDHEIQEV